MKFILLIKLICFFSMLLSPFLVLAKGAHKISRPTGTELSIEEEEDEHKNKLMFSYENDSYVYNETEYASPTIMFSTNGWDIGINSQNILIHEGTLQNSQNVQNDTYININKTFQYDDVFDAIDCGKFCDKMSDAVEGISTTLGSQTGTVLPMSGSAQPNHINSQTLHEFYFIDHDAELLKSRFSLHGGNYFVNPALSSTTAYIGYILGSELIVIPKKLKLNADFYSGRSNVSGTVAQATWMVNKNFELFFGAGLATSGSGNYDYWISGFNLIKIFEH